MCDYSLMSVPNRLAREGEELVAHRFQSGAMGLASASDLREEAALEPKTFWSFLKGALAPLGTESVTAVCIPPGARLRLENIPQRLQREIDAGAAEEVVFMQINASAYCYRDAVRLGSGRILLLQQLPEGQRVLVRDLSSAEVRDPVREMVALEGSAIPAHDAGR